MEEERGGKERPDTYAKINRTLIMLDIADITTLQVDALVSAATPELKGARGVECAIHNVGGSEVQKECRQIVKKHGRLEPGCAVITKAGKLPARFVIHAVCPHWAGGGNRESEILASAYQESLKLAESHKCQSLAFPSLSTGAFGYPVLEAAEVALFTIHDYLLAHPHTLLTLVRFALLSHVAMGAFRRGLGKTRNRA